MPSHARGSDAFWFFSILLSIPLVLLIILPLGRMITMPEMADLVFTIREKAVQEALGRSLLTALLATLAAMLFGTPLAYLLARKSFKGKNIIEGLVDLPIMIPHPVIGIAILSLFGRNGLPGRVLAFFNVEIMGSVTGIVMVLIFVGAPFYVNAVKSGFETIPQRLEKASRSLGAGMTATFFRVTFPMVWRHMMLGAVLCTARAISEFGAVVIVAYHPMTAPVLIYERFTAYGLKYSQCVAFWLILISLLLFVSMRLLSREREDR